MGFNLTFHLEKQYPCIFMLVQKATLLEHCSVLSAQKPHNNLCLAHLFSFESHSKFSFQNQSYNWD